MAKKKLKVTPEQNAQAIKKEVQVKLRSRYLERFDEFITDADDRIEKAMDAINANNFAAEVMITSDRSDEPYAKDAIESFKSAVEITIDAVKKTKVKRQAAIQLKELVDQNKEMLAIELLVLFDQMTQ